MVAKELSIFEIDEYKNNPHYLNFLQNTFKDQNYKELDGVYIVYQGHVDVVSHKDRSCLHQIRIFEHFGESPIL
jgi:hypothetical protein